MTLLPACLWLLAGCSATSEPVEHASQSDAVRLFDPAAVLQDNWSHVHLKGGDTQYRIAIMDERLAIQARGEESASALMRRVSVDPAECPTFEWSWNVTQMQPSANLRTREGDDVAASVFLLFGDPGFLFDPRPVPTIRYVWTNHDATAGEVIDNPYMPGVVRNVVVRSGREHLGQWITERRDIADDFVRAFGEKPTSKVHAVALFTDNDQTKEPVEAYYGRGTARCIQSSKAAMREELTTGTR